ncbi:MAG: hypothetical protein QXO27_04430 [Candidatus Aenigmatarchaeota archaeon]
MRKELIAVRGIDEDILRKFRARTIEERMKMGEALNLAMKRWVEERKKEDETKPDPRNLLKISGIIKTKKKVKWSEKIDEFLYGLEK